MPNRKFRIDRLVIEVVGPAGQLNNLQDQCGGAQSCSGCSEVTDNHNACAAISEMFLELTTWRQEVVFPAELEILKNRLRAELDAVERQQVKIRASGIDERTRASSASLKEQLESAVGQLTSSLAQK
jgi:hypothetical protein